MRRPTTIVTLAALTLALAGCGSSTTAAPTATTATALASASAVASASGDPIAQWCNAYTVITGVLADGMTGRPQAQKAILGLDRYAELWKTAGAGELLTPDEVNANLRAIAAYRTALNLVAAGEPESSADFTAAKDHIRTVTEDDHDVLQSSAGKVLGYCGAPSASASPSPS
jgi:hypothetical protein